MDIDVYRQKPLRVHSFLAGVPLRTLERVELPGGREGMTVKEVPGLNWTSLFAANERLLRRLATERHSWPPRFHTVVNGA